MTWSNAGVVAESKGGESRDAAFFGLLYRRTRTGSGLTETCFIQGNDRCDECEQRIDELLRLPDNHRQRRSIVVQTFALRCGCGQHLPNHGKNERLPGLAFMDHDAHLA